MALLEQDKHEQIGKKYNKVFDQQMKQGKAKLDQKFSDWNSSFRQSNQNANYMQEYNRQMEEL